jgi:hypothetical protein
VRIARAPILAPVALCAALAAASPAAAATQFGDPCVATGVTPNKTIVELSGPPGVQVTAPADGVVTRVQIAGKPGFPGTIVQGLKLLRSNGTPTGFTAASQDLLLVNGPTSYGYRLPVKTGDRLGLASEAGVFFCAGQSGDTTAFTPGELPLESSAVFKTTENIGVPIVATLEPDADGDGFGDETQDGCPQSAELIEPCPALGVDAFANESSGGARVYVSLKGPGTAGVAVVGKLALPPRNGRRTTLNWKAHHSGVAGQFTSFGLKFPKGLAALARSRHGGLTMKIGVTATNVAGLKTKKQLTLKVRGRSA